MDNVKRFIQENTHQLGYIMGEAARVWAERDPIGAITLGECKGIVDKYGQYHEILEELEKLRKWSVETRRF